MDNYIEYEANGLCRAFQNPFYTAASTDIVVTVNQVEVPTTEYEWLYGTKYVQFNTAPEKGDNVRITNVSLVTDPNPDLEIMRNDVSANTASITALQVEQGVQDTEIAAISGATNANATDIANNASSIATNSSDIANIVADITSLEAIDVLHATQIGTNTTNIAALSDQSSNISDLQSRMTVAEASIIVIQGDIVTINDSIVNLQKQINSLNSAYGEYVATGYFEIENNQTTPVDITEGIGDKLIIDANANNNVQMFVEFERQTDTDYVHTQAEFLLQYNRVTGLWSIQRIRTTALGGGEDDGIILTITNNAVEKLCNVHYTSSNLSGANHYGVIRWRINKMINLF